MSNVSIKYKVVAMQCSTMETLASTATRLQGSLGELESSLRRNWQGGGVDDLLTNYQDFVENINIITQDIKSVRDWCEDTTMRFKNASSQNRTRLDNAMRRS